MLKMVISCGGGMSSSALSVEMKKEIKERGWEDKVQIEFLAFPLLIKQKDLAFPIQFDEQSIDFDIAFLCPHLRYHVQNALKQKVDLDVPMYIMPIQMYGRMKLEELMEDAQDLLEIYKGSDEKLLHFPDEEILVTKRNTSHRRWLKKHPGK